MNSLVRIWKIAPYIAGETTCLGNWGTVTLIRSAMISASMQAQKVQWYINNLRMVYGVDISKQSKKAVMFL